MMGSNHPRRPARRGPPLSPPMIAYLRCPPDGNRGAAASLLHAYETRASGERGAGLPLLSWLAPPFALLAAVILLKLATSRKLIPTSMNNDRNVREDAETLHDSSFARPPKISVPTPSLYAINSHYPVPDPSPREQSLAELLAIRTAARAANRPDGRRRTTK